jgi:carotenoid cleavage dioxygenase-like enzyme
MANKLLFCVFLLLVSSLVSAASDTYKQDQLYHGAEKTSSAVDPLAGVFTTAAAEVLQETVVRPNFGTVPNWLCGSYIRQSASKFEENTRHLTHTFDGFGKLLRYKFTGNGNVSLRSNFLRSNFYNVSIATGDICPCRLLGTTDPHEPNGRAMTDNCTDNFNVNVVNIAGNIVLTSDYTSKKGAGKILNIEDMTTSEHKWNDTWTNYFDKITAAHPQQLPDGDTINFVMRINPMAIVGMGKHSIIVYRVNKNTNTREQIATIKVKKLPYIHSFTVTENYIILAAAPFTWELANIMAAKPVMNSLKWSPHDGTTLYVIGLSNHKVTEYNTDAFFAFHHINGYEANNYIYMDVLANNMTGGKVPSSGLTIHNMLNMSARNKLVATAEYRRYKIPMPSSFDSDIVKEVNFTFQRLIDQDGKLYATVELPRINDLKATKKNCYWYGWAPHAGGSSKFADTAIIKVNVCSNSNDKNAVGTDKNNVMAWFVEKHFPSEPIFVPKPNSTLEDDGVVLATVFDGEEGATYLVIIDATSMKTVATIYCEDDWKHLMSFGIHGDFFSCKN